MDIYLQLLVNVFEFVAFVIVLFKLKALYNSSLRLLIAVISFIFMTEMIGLAELFLIESTNQGRNFVYYNITTLIIILLYYALFFENIRVPKHKKIFLIACIITFFFYLINIRFIQTGQTFHTYSFTIGSVCLCLGIVFYLKEIVESDKIIYITKDPLFWISIGLFAFYIINIPYMGMYNYLVENYMDFLVLCRKISIVLNYFMYCCIIKGLLCLKN